MATPTTLAGVRLDDVAGNDRTVVASLNQAPAEKYASVSDESRGLSDESLVSLELLVPLELSIAGRLAVPLAVDSFQPLSPNAVPTLNGAADEASGAVRFECSGTPPSVEVGSCIAAGVNSSAAMLAVGDTLKTAGVFWGAVGSEIVAATSLAAGSLEIGDDSVVGATARAASMPGVE